VDIAVLDREVARQQSIFDAMPSMADLLRSDVLYFDGTPDQLVVAAHAQPRTTTSLYPDNCKGQSFAPASKSLLLKAIRKRKRHEGMADASDASSESFYHEVLPLYDHTGIYSGALSIETAQIEYDTAKRRPRNLQVALHMFKQTVSRGDLRGARSLAPVSAGDGLLVVGQDMKIAYASPIAHAMYGRIGVTQEINGQRINTLETGDELLIKQAFIDRECFEAEGHARDAIWIRKTIPLIKQPPRPHHNMGWLMIGDTLPEPQAVLLLIRDVTIERQRQQDDERVETMIKEIHHRVKNNLQMIISFARVEARRTESSDTKRALEEITNRIFAIAQVHEYLLAGNFEEIQLKDVCRQVAKQVRDSLLQRDSRIRIEVEGDPLSLPPRQATACALIVNELLQNAVQHAFEDNSGVVRIQLEDSGERIRIAVADNGRGLPQGFEWRHSQRLGLQIVHTMVQDLHGDLKLRNHESPAHGLVAQITLYRQLLGGK
jgi:two-component sensor histidine kinase